jgi:hypothetical protein
MHPSGEVGRFQMDNLWSPPGDWCRSAEGGAAMKIECHCGTTIFDCTDDLPQKGHFIPDQEWFATYDAMDDEVIVPLTEGAIDREKAFHLSRRVISRASRLMYQCSVCGRLYIDDKDRVLHCYVPSAETTSKDILRGHGDHSEP